VEREVALLVDDLLTDPERITRELDEAIAREEANHRNPDDAAAFWASRINDLARLRAKNQEMYRAETMTLDELKAETARLEEERAVAEEELAHARDAGQRLTELHTHREEVFRMLQTSLALGLIWFPPHLRRQVYEALGLRATIHTGGPLGPGYGPNVSVEGWLDAGAWRYTEELAQFARGLAEADQRLQERAKDDPPASVSEGVERLERELGRVPGVCPYGQSAVTHSGGCLSLPPGT
jgi:hypothetical protein